MIPEINRRLISLVVTLLVMISLIVLPFSQLGLAQSLNLEAKASLLMDARSGRVLYEQNGDASLPMASVTKLMTLIVILEAVEAGQVQLDDLVSTSEYAASMRGTRVWLEEGEQLPLKELIYAIAVGSANDASVAVAEYLSGSERDFVTLMNQKAQELGMSKTEFSNSNGLPPREGENQVMSVRDAAILARYALGVPTLMDYVSTYEYTMRAQTTKKPQLWNYNKLLRRYPGVDGFKTGFTTDAGYCMVVTAERDDLRLIGVIFGASSDAKREAESRALLDYGFTKYRSLVVLPKGTEQGTIQVRHGDPWVVPTVLLEDLIVTIERGSEQKVTTALQYVQDFTDRKSVV